MRYNLHLFDKLVSGYYQIGDPKGNQPLGFLPSGVTADDPADRSWLCSGASKPFSSLPAADTQFQGTDLATIAAA
jgi:hypothetical protein